MAFPNPNGPVSGEVEPGTGSPDTAPAPEQQPGTPGDVSPGAPQEPATDAGEKDLGSLQSSLQEAQETIQALQGDIAATKSTFQTQLAARQQEWEQQQREYRQYIDNLEMQLIGDDEEALQEYQERRRQRELEERTKALSQREQQLQEQQLAMGWENYFVNEIGVPQDALNRNGGLRSLHDSGHTAIKELVTDLRGTANQLQQQNAGLMKLLQQNNVQIPEGLKASVQVSKATESPRNQRKQPPTVVTRTPETETPPTGFEQRPLKEQAQMLEDFKAGRISADAFKK